MIYDKTKRKIEAEKTSHNENQLGLGTEKNDLFKGNYVEICHCQMHV